MKKIVSMLLFVMLLASCTVNSFAETQSKYKKIDLGERIAVMMLVDSKMAAIGGDSYEPCAGRHYNVKEEIKEDQINNTYLYPIGENERTALKKVLCIKQTHYKYYRMRVGDPDYKVFLYDEYHTTWKGYVRKSTGEPWTLKYDYTNQITRDRGPITELLDSI